MRRMPTVKAISKFWAEKGLIDLSDYGCFACGMLDQGTLERAHIQARCLGGSDDVSNLHLLCSTCHKDSEYLEGDAYWRFIEDRTPIDMMISAAARGGLNIWSEIGNVK